MWRLTIACATFAAGVLVGLLVREPLLTICGRQAAHDIMAIKLGATGTETSPSPSTSGSGTPRAGSAAFFERLGSPWIRR